MAKAASSHVLPLARLGFSPRLALLPFPTCSMLSGFDAAQAGGPIPSLKLRDRHFWYCGRSQLSSVETPPPFAWVAASFAGPFLGGK